LRRAVRCGLTTAFLVPYDPKRGTSMRPRFARVVAWIALTFCHTPVFAAAAIDILRVDLNPLIDSAARSRVQFAVNIPRAVSSSAQGSWSQHGSLSTWVYSARIPTAVSMSFHASGVVLPPTAQRGAPPVSQRHTRLPRLLASIDIYCHDRQNKSSEKIHGGPHLE
jgi:hypothetical protein